MILDPTYSWYLSDLVHLAWCVNFYLNKAEKKVILKI